MKKSNTLNILLLQTAVVVFALSSVAGKFASRYSFLSLNYVLCYGVEILLLGIYAIAWQQIIKKTDISIAYANKATNIFWSMIFAVLFFSEHISFQNIIGVIIIFIGVLMVNKND